jgi:hypothetical protein
MFNNLAEIGVARRHVVPDAVPVHCNDNRPDRRPAAVSKRARPQGLTCHWRAAASGGGLECYWQVEPADEASAEPAGPSCTTEQMRGPPGFGLRGQPAIRAATA